MCFCVVFLVLLLLCYFIDCTIVLFFKQKTAYDMRISDWSSDVCSSDLAMRYCWMAPPEPPSPTTCAGSAKASMKRSRVIISDSAESTSLHIVWNVLKEIGRATWRERVCQYV